jgi:hypothetical protein
MKSFNLFRLLGLSLIAFLLSGCFNPITVVPPKSGNPFTDPFTVDIVIGQDGSARSVAGAGTDHIKGGLRNFAQLIVIDSQGNIAAFDETRRASAAQPEGVLAVDSINFGQTYHFLLLMGHWEHDGNYGYYDTEADFRPPTLLAAGMKDQLVTGSGKVTIAMWPLVTDTVFTTENSDVPPAQRTAEPVISGGKPGTASLLPVEWGITWTVKRGPGGNGFTDLVRAQKMIAANGQGDDLLLKSGKGILRGEGFTGDAEKSISVNENRVTLGIHDYTAGIRRIGKGGSANFALEYIPFNLTSGKGNPWAAYDGESVFDLSGTKTPVWIIRNGLNGKEQDGGTDFGKAGTAEGNGNGAVRFVTAAGSAGDGELLIKDEKFLRLAGSSAEIKFKTEGYSGDADTYYAVVPGGAAAPEYSRYTGSFGGLAPATYERAVTLPSPGDANYREDNNYDIYVILMKGGKVGSPVKINTAPVWTLGPRFVGVNVYPASNEVAWSADGVNWTMTENMPATVEWMSVAYGNGVFVATALDSDKAAWSANGVNWTAATMPSTARWYNVAYGNGVFVAVADTTNGSWSHNGEENKAAYSLDNGKTWSAATMPVKAYWITLSYGGGRFVATTYSTNKAAWSADGVNWTMTTMPSSSRWVSLTYGAGKFVAFGDDYKVAYSTDGAAWTGVTLPSDGYSGERFGTYGNGKFAAYTDTGKTTTGKAVFSTDGVTWTSATITWPSSETSNWTPVPAYGAGKFIILRNFAVAASVYYSADGINWAIGTLPAREEWSGIAYAE